MRRGYCVTVVDLPDSESLKGTRLQRTLLRVGKLPKNLARYEGIDYLPLSGVSGKVCPLCSARGIRVGARHYRCVECGLVRGRDWSACYRLAKAYLKARKRG
ncbi:MAG: hypothetical protein DRK00_10940 [Thermoprotei archaeon]|nr:MAG: hypothetical protein DRK00_10940 [Thermoprotei archaeon]